MLKSLTRSLVRLLLAILIGMATWYGVYRLTIPQPHHACIPRLIEDAPFPTRVPYVEPRHFRFDSTGWWFAVGPSRFNTDPAAMTWQVHHLKTGHVRTYQWDDTLDPQSWVPLEAGYRHTRRTKDGGIEVVDTSFVDGSSKVVMRFAANHLADERIYFSLDGKRAVTTHRMPLIKLLALGPLPAVNCADEMMTGLTGWFKDAHVACPRQARFWKLPEGVQGHIFLLPAFTDQRCLQSSPCGRWLMCLETLTNYQNMLANIRSNQAFVPVNPRGVVLCDGDTGSSQVITHKHEHASQGNYFGHINETGLALGLVTAAYTPVPGSTMLTFGLDGTDPESLCRIYTLADLKQIPWINVLYGNSAWNVLPITTVDGKKVGITCRNRQYEVARLNLNDTLQITTSHISILQSPGPSLQPLAIPGQVLVTYEPYRAYQQVIDWFKETLNYDIEKYLPDHQVVSACVVDLSRETMVWKSSLSVPLNPSANLSPYNYDPRLNLVASPPQFTTTWDRKALWAGYTSGKEFHLYRWELPLQSWSPWWSFGAGMLAFLAMLWLTRKRRPKYSATPAC